MSSADAKAAVAARGAAAKGAKGNKGAATAKETGQEDEQEPAALMANAGDIETEDGDAVSFHVGTTAYHASVHEEDGENSSGDGSTSSDDDLWLRNHPTPGDEGDDDSEPGCASESASGGGQGISLVVLSASMMIVGVALGLSLAKGVT